jgi:hypothetical protein
MRATINRDCRDFTAGTRIDNVPFRLLKRRHVQKLAVGGHCHSIAAVCVVPFLPDQFVRDEVKSGQSMNGAHIEQACLRTGGNTLDVLVSLSSRRRPRSDALHELVLIIDVEHKNAGAAMFGLVAHAWDRGIDQPSFGLPCLHPGKATGDHNDRGDDVRE